MARKSRKALDDEILSRIDKRALDWFTYYSKNNNLFRQIMKFIYEEDGQWTTPERDEYQKDGRTMLTFNMIPRYITNLAAEFGRNVPDVEVRSEHFKEVDQTQIDVATNLLRNISFDSRNDIVYQTAAQNAWTGGYGAFRIIVERERAGSFNFVVRYRPIYDPTTCFWDPMARLVDKSDGNYAGIAFPMSKSEFKNKYPGIPIPSATPLINEQQEFVWVTDEQLTIVDYWERVPVQRKFALLSDNSVVDGDEAEAIVRKRNREINALKKEFPNSQVEPLTIEKIEMHDDFKIMFYRAIKDKILESSEWDGRFLPIIFMGGQIKWVNGKERTYGLVHWMRDAQRAYNYARNEYLYRLKLTRYEKFLVTKENIANNEEAWQNVYKAKSALIYKRGSNGEIPIHLPPASIGADLQAEMSRSLSDLQLIPGRFEANFGAQGNEVSGIAIATRQTGGNLNVQEFFDNATKAIESGARATMDLLPKVYDTTRNVTVTLRDQAQKVIPINSNAQNRLEELFFDVKVSMGSSFAIQQTENVQKLLELVKVNPQLANLVSDIIVKNLDIQHGPQLVERIQRWSIPTIAASEGSQDPIVQKQAQEAQNNPTQQLAQQEAQIQLQKGQLELQTQKQDILLKQMDAMNDRLKSVASQTTANANMMNAQTNRAEALTKGIQESNREITEERKAELELQTEIIRAASQGMPREEDIPRQNI